MKKLITIFLFILAMNSSAFALKIGDVIPSTETKMKNVDEKEITLSSIKDKNGLLVIFSCNACPFVKAWESRMVALGNEYKGKGVGVVAINANDPQMVPEDGFEVMKTRYKEKGFQFPYVVDATSDLARAFGATRTPEVFLFNKEGKLIYHGAIDDDAHEPEKVKNRYLVDALHALISEKKIVNQETNFIGCTIKFRNKK